MDTCCKVSPHEFVALAIFYMLCLCMQSLRATCVMSQVSAAEMQAVRRVPLSPDALCLSFGHFLELSFGAHQLKIDDRSLHEDFVRYLGMGMIASASLHSTPRCMLVPHVHCCTVYVSCPSPQAADRKSVCIVLARRLKHACTAVL